MRLAREYRGALRAALDVRLNPHRLFLTVPCRVAGLPIGFDALVDTAAEWCVLPALAARALGFGAGEDYPTRLGTRLGVFHGRLERLTLLLPADQGQDLEVEATWFVCPDWPGPLVLGWKGCLERFRFGLDPQTDTFYFGET